MKIYTKMWELWVHPDYDHLYIPLTSKQGVQGLQAFTFSVVTVNDET